MRYFSRVPLVLLAVGLLASLWTAVRRVAVERMARTVELTVDMEQLRQLTLDLGVPLPLALDRLKVAGVTSIALSEESLGELETDGIAQVRHGVPSMPAGLTEVRLPDAGLYRQVASALRLKLRSAGDRVATSPRVVRILGPSDLLLDVPAGWTVIRSMAIGLPQQEVALVRKHGLRVVARVSNFTAADATSITAVAQQLRQAGTRTVIFAGDEVLGNRDRVKETAAALDAQGLRYGSVEFGKQMGDDTLSRALQARIVRVHSIQNAEMQKLSVDEAVDRFVKAAEERNIRLLYLRLLPHVPKAPFEDNLAYIAAVAQGVRQRGMTLGSAETFARVYPETRMSAAALFSPPEPEAGRGRLPGRLLSRFVPALSALAVAGGAVLLLAGLVRLPLRTQSHLALLGGVLAGLAVMGGGDLGRKLVALVGAMLFPSLAFVWFPPVVSQSTDDQLMVRGGANGTHPASGAGKTTRPRSPFLHFGSMSAVSLMGALTVVGLLSERQFMMKVSGFMGIKAAHFLPILAVAILYAADAFHDPRPWPETRERARASLARLLGGELRMWHLAVGLIALVLVGFLLARTGNDPGVGVSGTEMSLRNMLDRYLVRPRTKEFLIGHPALLAALLLGARRAGRGVCIALALIGSIGQVSMVNSFCHLHTPLLMTLARTFNGLWLGVLFGLALTWLLQRYLPLASHAFAAQPAALAGAVPER
jgi:uncharacterized protein DUF5693